MHVMLESTDGAIEGMEDSIRDVLKLRATVEWLTPDSLPKDGIVIEDKRDI